MRVKRIERTTPLYHSLYKRPYYKKEDSKKKGGGILGLLRDLMLK